MFTPALPMKNSRPVLLSMPVVVSSLIIGVVLAAGTAILSSVSTRDIATASNQVASTQATLLAINQLRASVIDAETGQRGYILTGLDSYLDPYTQATARFDEQLAHLRTRLANSPEQTATLNQVATLMSTKETEMSRTIELRRALQIGPALHLVDSGAGLKTMNNLREAMHTLEERELSTLALNSASVSRRAGFFQMFSLGMLITACVLGATGALLFMNRLHELETMITVCAWTRRVKYKGAWVSFEEYLRARFNLRFTHGISEEAAKKLQMEAVELVESDPNRFKAVPARLA
jgi:CHASE3 domain sensor protein